MPKEKIDLREELRSYKFEFDLLQKIPCSKQENKKYAQLLKENGVLPEGVYAYIDDNDEPSKTEFYTIYETDLTKSEIEEYLTYKKLDLIKTIKNCVMFFTILTIVSMIVYFLIMTSSF